MSIATPLLTDAATGPEMLASTTLERAACRAKRLTLGFSGHLFAMPYSARFTDRSPKAAVDADDSSAAMRQCPQ
eukprot:9054046-Pyramimonas_sp.AAC.1